MVTLTLPRGQYAAFKEKLPVGSRPSEILANGAFDGDGNFMLMCGEEEALNRRDIAEGLCPEIASVITKAIRSAN